VKQIRRGASLPEVCVALTVFLVGATGLLVCWNFFNREVAGERFLLDRYYRVTSSMESLIAEPPLCVDSLLLLLDSVVVRLERVPGSKRLTWAVVENDGLALKRLVRCR